MALAFQIIDVDGMLENMTSSQIAVWQQYEAMYGPINPYVRGDVGTSIIASEVFRHIAKSPKKVKAKDFLPYPIHPPQPTIQSVKKLKSVMLMLAAASQNNG